VEGVTFQRAQLLEAFNAGDTFSYSWLPFPKFETLRKFTGYNPFDAFGNKRQTQVQSLTFQRLADLEAFCV
jgi:hypothetical protein